MDGNQPCSRYGQSRLRSITLLELTVEADAGDLGSVQLLCDTIVET